MSIARSSALVVMLLLGDAGCWLGLAPDRAAALAPGARLDQLLAGIAAVSLQTTLGWLTVLVVLAALEPVAGRPLTAYAGCPGWLRQGLVVACGLAATSALADPAVAGHLPRGHVAPVATVRLEGLSSPDRTVDRPPSAQVVVRRGDSLWYLARDQLGPSASDASVDRLWRATYAANRARVGPDPDLIQPGTRLDLPAPAEEHR